MMKSVKFLTALCIAAMLASCAKDEYVAQDQTQQRDEYVGADLLGTDVSMTVGFGTDTKISNGDWELTDQLGLGWLVNGNDFANASTVSLGDTDNKLYANHMYNYVGNGKFTSKGNIYEGWHYAYFPYVYEKVAAKDKIVTVNPTQKLKGLAASRNEMLHLSGAAKLTKKNNLDGAMNLVGVDYVLEPAFSVIGVTVNPSDAFTGSETLKKSKITGITLKVDGTNMFAKEVQVKGADLDNLATVASNSTAKKELLKSFADALYVTEWAEEVYTKVENTEITLAETQELRFFVKPGYNVIDPSKVTIVVSVEGGEFTIAQRKSTASDYSAMNNTAIASLVAAYGKDGSKLGALYDDLGGSTGVRGLSLDLELTEDMFTPDFSSITTASEWNQAVNIANDLNCEEVDFNLDGKIEIEEGVELSIPNAETFTVHTDANSNLAGIYVNTDYLMSKELAAALSETSTSNKNNLVVVKEGATLTLAADNKLTTSVNEAAILAVSNLTNAGTIDLGYHSTIKNLYNDNGRVNVIYGSYVEGIKSTDKGVIAFIATGNDSASELNELMSDANTQTRYATINTIVVNEGIAFSLKNAYAGNSEYNDGQTLNATLLKDITVEMNGGTLVDGEVKAVVVKSGANNVLNNVFADELDVNAGAVAVKSTAVEGLIKDIQYTKVINSGTLKAETDIYTAELETKPNSNTYAEGGVGIYYNIRTSQSGNSYGIVTESSYDTSSLPGVVKVLSGEALVSAIADYTNIKLASDITLELNDSDQAVAGTSYNININGKNIDGNGYSINSAITDKMVKNSKGGQGVAIFTVDGTAATATISNIIFASANTQYDVIVKDGATLNAKDCQFITATNSNMKNSQNKYMGKRAIFVSGTHGIISIDGGVFDDKVYAFNENATNGVNNKFSFSNVELKGWMSGKGEHTFTKCTFAKSGDYANYIPYGTATFTDCKFEEDFTLSVVEGRDFTFTNCTRGYVAVENPANLKWDISGGSKDWVDTVTNFDTQMAVPAAGAIKAKVNGEDYLATVKSYKEGNDYDTVVLEWTK